MILLELVKVVDDSSWVVLLKSNTTQEEIIIRSNNWVVKISQLLASLLLWS